MTANITLFRARSHPGDHSESTFWTFVGIRIPDRFRLSIAGFFHFGRIISVGFGFPTVRIRVPLVSLLPSLCIAAFGRASRRYQVEKWFLERLTCSNQRVFSVAE